MNISLPESMGFSNPALSVSNPPSFSGISDSDSPTYLISQPSSLPSSQSVPVSPMVASSNTPALPMSPIVPAITPVMPAMPVPRVQPPVNVTPFTPPVSGSYPLVEAGGPLPVVTPAFPASAQAAPSLMPSSAPPSPARKRRVRRGFVALAALLLVVLLGSGVLLYLIAIHTSLPSQTVVGHAFFVSSGLISKESNQGITDELSISLQNIGDPQLGKRYYGWLMSNVGSDAPPLALGPLPVDHGQIAMTYSDPQHNNLLANYSRFLITEQDASQQPTNPSLDVQHVWRYYSAFSIVPNPVEPKHYSLFDHLRHLLSADPKLSSVGLSGGLSEWLYRNTTKILEAAGSARDSQKGCADEGCADFILRQVARILDYLDGSDYVKTENIPLTIQGDQLLIDPTVARVALLEFDPLNQQPPGYLEHIGTHLQEISQNS